MCLVIGVFLGVLGINFYFNGFYVQSVLSLVSALVLFVFMLKNISCIKNSCTLKKEEKE
ncbi:hypothetical protein JHD50_04545 [Sulfurimonas sp. MAG313]|nr:hypothetical protein [Sulfurimonas sp. MAG313]MDF1880576.1 hypothetical protein [Sulfurimonas sp. MAG313]